MSSSAPRRPATLSAAAAHASRNARSFARGDGRHGIVRAIATASARRDGSTDGERPSRSARTVSERLARASTRAPNRSLSSLARNNGSSVPATPSSKSVASTASARCAAARSGGSTSRIKVTSREAPSLKVVAASRSCRRASSRVVFRSAWCNSANKRTNPRVSAPSGCVVSRRMVARCCRSCLFSSPSTIVASHSAVASE